MLCSAMSFLMGASDFEQSCDVWNALVDICVLNGADKQDVVATLPFLSPFDLPDSVVAADESQVHKVMHLLSVVSLLQQFPHALEISLSTWLFVSLCSLHGVGIEPVFLQANYISDVVNAMLLFEPNETLTALAHRVIHRFGVGFERECETLHAIPLNEMIYDIVGMLQSAMQHGELAHGALLHRFLKRKKNTQCVTLAFSSLHVSAMDILVSYQHFCKESKRMDDQTVFFETETTVFWTLDFETLKLYQEYTQSTRDSSSLNVWRWKSRGMLETTRHFALGFELFNTLVDLVLD